MKYSFKEIINIDKIQSLIKSFCEAIGIAAAIIDLDGKVLVSSGWQKICTEFHRKNPQTLQRCIESDTILANKMLEGRKYAVYQCRNGLINAAAPIVIEGDHIANLFIGQFLFEPADKEYFQKQADEYGFDKTSYLEALSKAPVISKKQIEPFLNFFSGFAEFLCEMGLKQIRQLKADEAQYESEKKYRIFFNNSIDAMLIIEGYLFTDCNNAALSMLKYNNKEDIINKHPSELSSEFQLDGKNSYKKANEMMDIAYKKGSHFFEWRHTQKNGDVLPIEVSLTAIPMGKKKILHTVWRDISERKRAEKALRESEEKYRQLVKHAPSAIYEIDYQKDKFTNVNDVFCDYTGYSRKELLSITPFDILTEDSKKHFNERLKKISMGEQVPEKVEFKIRRKNGQEIWVLLNVSFIFENGSLKKSAVIAHDITKRKRIEEALRESEEKMRLILDSMPDLVLQLNTNLEILWANNAAIKLNHHAVGQLCYKALSDKNTPCPNCPIVKALKTGKIERSIVHLESIKGVGESYWDDVGIPIKDVQGKITSIVKLARNVTDRKQAEEALRKSKNQYKYLYRMVRLMCDNLPDLIWTKDLENRFIFTNKACCEQLLNAKNTDEPIGKTDIYFADREKESHPENPDYHTFGATCTGSDLAVLKSKKPKRTDEFGNVKGEFLYLDVYKAPFGDEKGNIIGTVGCAKDVTKEKQLEEEHKQAEDRIKHLNGVLNAIRNVNQLILLEKDKNRLMQKSCDALIDARDYDLAWLGFLRDDKNFVSIVSSGMGKDIKNFKEKVMSGDHPPCVKKALIRKNHLIVVDKLKECGNCVVKNICTDKEAAIIHVEHGGSLFGLLAVSLRSGVPIDDEEKELLKEVAGDIAFALYNMDLEKARRQAEEALRQSEERLRIKLEYILSPDEDIKDVSLSDIVDLKDLQQIQDAFATANDVASIISDIDGKPITKPSNFCGVCEIIRSTKKGNRNCIKSDKILGKKAKAFMKPIYEECHSCGFIDASAPIIVGGKHIANWLIGQSNIMGVDKHRIETYAKEIDADKNKMLSAFKKMPEMSLAKFEERLDLLWIMAKEISTLGYSNIILAKDITELKQADYKLQKAHEELETRVKERTAELQTANKELEAFSYSVSHDLRAPLRAIDGFSQILLEDYQNVLDEEGQHYLQRVRAGTQNMGQLIDDILHLSRIGRQPMVKETIKLENIAKQTYKLLKNEWKDRKLNFSVHQCPSVQADPRLMQIVFTNLLSNALKFTKNKKAAKIEVGSKTKDGQNVFYVKDNGAGFDMKYVDKLFSPFQRLHSSEEYEGTGIGTAIVKRIIVRHSGKIWVESKVSKGTVFYFTLNEGMN